MNLLTHFLFLSILISSHILQAQQIDKGSISGAKYMVATPADWNGSLLIIAHGYVPDDQPLSANFSPDKEFYRSLVRNGWLVTATSYRRNGLIVEEAIEDIDNLYDHIQTTHGKPEKTIIQGSSMGGFIGTLIAENPGRDYSGVLNMGAGLQLNDRSETIRLNYRPKIPILFLSNQSEYEAPENYAKTANGATVSLWKIDRNGHVNINQKEQALALQALEKMVRSETIPLVKNGTVELKPPSTVIFDNDGAIIEVIWSDPVYGNLNSNLVPGDLKQLNISLGESFELEYQDKLFSIQYGTTYNDVPDGSWVAFLSGDGTIQISCNYCNAANSLDYKNGDTLFIKKIKND